jgi:hypothetical protein
MINNFVLPYCETIFRLIAGLAVLRVALLRAITVYFANCAKLTPAAPAANTKTSPMTFLKATFPIFIGTNVRDVPYLQDFLSLISRFPYSKYPLHRYLNVVSVL